MGPMDSSTFAGPHPTCRELLAQLQVWGFVKRKEDGVHAVYRGPHGGTIRVLRSGLGRVDPALADKAARLAGVTTTEFWIGKGTHPVTARDLPSSTTDVNGGEIARRKENASDTAADRQADVAPQEAPAARAGTPAHAELFNLLFPAGVQLTGELLADLEQWAHLTGKFVAHQSSPPAAA